MENVNYIHNLIAPKSNAFIMPIVLIAFFVLLIIGCIGIMYSIKNTEIKVTDDSLKIKSFFYGKSISLNDINSNGIRKINLDNDYEYDVRIRTNGIGMPSYKVGWMKLNNGNKALVYLTDKTNVALIPTKDYDILISTDDFDGLKKALSK